MSNVHHRFIRLAKLLRNFIQTYSICTRTHTLTQMLSTFFEQIEDIKTVRFRIRFSQMNELKTLFHAHMILFFFCSFHLKFHFISSLIHHIFAFCSWFTENFTIFNSYFHKLKKKKWTHSKIINPLVMYTLLSTLLQFTPTHKRFYFYFFFFFFFFLLFNYSLTFRCVPTELSSLLLLCFFIFAQRCCARSLGFYLNYRLENSQMYRCI